MSTERAGDALMENERASTLELFLDLVFVFTVTQLTALVTHPDGGADYTEAALILAMTWWMYDGYVWLTGNISMDRRVGRLGIFAGMAGFLFMAMAIPGAFGPTDVAPYDSALVFGLAYLGVVVVHAVLFTTAPNSSAQAIRRIAPFNLAGAALVLAAAFVPDDRRWICWVAAVAVVASSTVFGRNQGWALSASHFVERHGLVVIVALGESVVAIGVGSAGLEIDATLVVTASLALALSASLWWLYFDHDDEDANAALNETTGDRRSKLGLWFAYAHAVMVAGIVLAAAGVKSVLAHPTGATDAAGAWNLAAGLTIYVAGEAAFRASLGRAAWVGRAALGLLALLTVPIGLRVSGAAQLAVADVLMVLLVLADGRATTRRRRAR